jgi:hypothetical protein
VSSALAEPPVAPTQQQPGAGAPAPAGAGPLSPPAQAAPPRSCAKCGAALRDGQDWCLQCGTGVPDSLRTRTPTWRSAAVIFTALALLIAGAGGAAYAALSKDHRASSASTKTLAQVPPAATVPSATPAPLPAPSTSIPATPTIGVPTTIKPSTPPKIPLSAATPTPPPVPSTSGAGGSTPTAPSDTKTTSPSTPVGEAHPQALLLDTNAASTYNPYNYAAGNFGDPNLAIDGDRSTGWTALVEPSVAPKMAEGLVIDLNTPRKLSALGLTTTTPGMTVQVYGAGGQAPPNSITAPAWVALTPEIVAKKKHAQIKLGGSSAAVQAAAKKPYRFVVLWISQAPASAVGTPEAPGRVSVNELELFPLKKA